MIYILLGVCLLFCTIVCCSCLCLLSKSGKKGSSPQGGGGDRRDSQGSGESTPSGSGSWKDGYATWYNSYPACCKDSPTYSKSASKSECSDYSGCKYMGKFAGYNGKMQHDEVKRRNIVAFYDDANQKGKGAMSWWNEHAKNKKIEIRNPSSGKTMVVEVLDTCGNHDCNNCCSKNSQKGGGYLLDLEGYTATRFWGEQKNGKLQWRWA